MSSGETHPSEEGWDAPPERRVEEDATRYPGHEDPDDAREDVGLPDRDGEDAR